MVPIIISFIGLTGASGAIFHQRDLFREKAGGSSGVSASFEPGWPTSQPQLLGQTILSNIDHFAIVAG